MNPTRRRILQTMAAASAAASRSPWPAFAQAAYPARPVRVIVPYAAGGGTDFFARLVFGAVGEQLGQQFVIENKPGAGTNIGAQLVAHSDPDGYTLYITSVPHATNRFLYASLGYDPVADFAPVTLICLQPNVMVVPNASPAFSWRPTAGSSTNTTSPSCFCA